MDGLELELEISYKVLDTEYSLFIAHKTWSRLNHIDRLKFIKDIHNSIMYDRCRLDEDDIISHFILINRLDIIKDITVDVV